MSFSVPWKVLTTASRPDPAASARPSVPKKPRRSSVPWKSARSREATAADEVDEREIRSRSAAMADSLIPSLRTLKPGTFDALLAWWRATSCQLLLQTDAPELPGSVSDV